MPAIWITDGSLVPFSDVERLSAKHRGAFGLQVPYKGLVDPQVAQGSGVALELDPEDALCVEAEWCVTAPGGLRELVDEPQLLTPDTPIVMQGLIEGKWLNRLLTSDAWGPATIGNNLLARGPGISTTFGRIEAGRDAGRIDVVYGTAAGPVRRQSSDLRDLPGHDLLELVRAVLQRCRAEQTPIDAIDLGAIGATAALVNEPARMREAMRLPTIGLPDPVAFVWPRQRRTIARRVVAAILREHLEAAVGANITLSVFGPNEQIVGRGDLRLTSGARSVASAGAPPHRQADVA
jgi:hypothetical protein